MGVCMTPAQKKKAKKKYQERINGLLGMFHHVHHSGTAHRVHHCGNGHDDADYKIEHCTCGKHRIDKEKVTTEKHSPNEFQIDIFFNSECPDGGWHIESGEVRSTEIYEILCDLNGIAGKVVRKLQRLNGDLG